MSDLIEKVALAMENAKRASIPLRPLDTLMVDREDKLIQARVAIETIINEILSDDFVKEVSDNWSFTLYAAESIIVTRNALRAGIRKTMPTLLMQHKGKIK